MSTQSQEEQPERISISTESPSEAILDALGQLIPGAIQDGVIDVQRLAELSGLEVSGVKNGSERFGLMWAGKSKGVEALQAPSMAALVPDLDNSIDWDAAENVFIEGDNLEVLKLLQKAYNDQVKLIYIDPPYNTGNDFVYNDDFSEPLKHYLEVTGQVDSDGNRLVANTEVSGRKHSNWLSMMYPRLVLARNLLCEDGAIFISIDDNEVANLLSIGNEIFGESNFVGSVAVKMSHLSGVKMSHTSLKIPKIKEWLLIWSRNRDAFTLDPIFERATWDEVLNRYTSFLVADNPEDLSTWRRIPLRDALKNVAAEDQESWKLENAKSIFRTARNDSLRDTPNDGLFREVVTSTGLRRIVFKQEEVIFASERLREINGSLVPAQALGDIWTDIGINNLHNEGGVAFPNGKKPLKLLDRVLNLVKGDNDIILDFFAGSGSLAEAVTNYNRQHKTNRKYVLVNIAEPLQGDIDVLNEGCQTVADVTRRRIHRLIEQGLDSQEKSVKMLRLNKSSFLSLQHGPDNALFPLLERTVDTLSPKDAIAAEVLLKSGVRLDAPWKRFEVAGEACVISGSVCVVLANQLTDEICQLVCEMDDLHTVVFLEDAFAGRDAVKANAHFAFKQANKTMKTI